MCGLLEDQRFVAPVVGGPAEGLVIELVRHEFGAHRPVEDEDALGERFEVGGRHAKSFGRRKRIYTTLVHELLYWLKRGH